MRQRVSGSSPYEAIVGYCRAVRVGDQVFVAGTTATDESGRVVGDGDAYLQTKQVLQNIEAALLQVGAAFKDVVRTRSFVVRMSDWQEVGRAHGEVFQAIRPAATMVQVAGLIDPAMLVEIEVDAVIREDNT